MRRYPLGTRLSAIAITPKCCAKSFHVEIGYFNHIPFPSFEVFSHVALAQRITHWAPRADLIGFHTYDDMRHFLSSVSRLTSYSVSNHYDAIPGSPGQGRFVPDGYRL